MQKQQRGPRFHNKHVKEGLGWPNAGTGLLQGCVAPLRWDDREGGWSSASRPEKKCLNLQCPISGQQSGKGLIRAS